MLKILVTGATGSVGCCIIPALLKASHDVLCIVSCKVNDLQSKLFNSLEVSNCKIESQLNWSSPSSSAKGLINTVVWYKNESSV